MKKLLSLLVLTTLVLSCQKNKETAQDSQAFDQQRDSFFANMLTPGEAAAALQATAAEFNPNLMNDPKLSSGYSTSDVKAAANLGVYLADLNYSVAYKQSANTKELFTASQELSQAIGIQQSILTFLSKRYNDNIAQNDSVQAVINELFKKSTADLKGTDREKLVGIAMAGYQIENLHLAVGIIEAYPKDMLPDDARLQILIPVFRLVLSQQKNVENIYAFLKTIADPLNPEANPNHAYYSTAFEELIAVYKKLNVEEKIANNQGVELMKDEVVQELSAKINAIRNKIVSAS
ncbi:MAG TPA: hypothetical protein VFU05_12165 [Cyclobacteriaceae bacterium]|nr:hypothetical protein [Cyclobacteriaceae bacterium]